MDMNKASTSWIMAHSFDLFVKTLYYCAYSWSETIILDITPSFTLPKKLFSGRLIFEHHSWLDNLLSKCVARGSEVSLLLAGRRRNRWLATCQSHQRHHFTPSTSSTSPSTTWSTWISFTCHLAVTHCQRKSISTNNNTIASKPHHNSQLLHITLQSQVFQGVPGLT